LAREEVNPRKRFFSLSPERGEGEFLTCGLSKNKLSLALLSHELQAVRTIVPESGIGGSNTKSQVFSLSPERGV